MHAEHAKRTESEPRLGAGSIQPAITEKLCLKLGTQ